MLMQPLAARGMTLIELMIALAILGVLLGLGLPAFSTFLANGKVRNATETLSAGLSLARSEAMRRNRSVEFLLTNDTVTAATVGTVTPSASGRHWLVRVLDPAEADFPFEGPLRLRSPEGSQLVETDGGRARRGYLEALQRISDEWSQRLLPRGGSLLTVVTRDDPVRALRRVLGAIAGNEGERA